MKTIFEKIIDREIPADIIYEDEKHIAFLNITPFEKGHTLVCPKHPYPTIFDMPKEGYLSLQALVHTLGSHIATTLDADMNIFQNNGHFSGREVEHVHVHLVPRRTEKKLYRDDHDEIYEEGEKDAYAEKLRVNGENLVLSM